MSHHAPDLSPHAWARLAGGLYLLVMAAYLGGVALTWQHGVRGDPAATARRIAEGETLYRAGLALQLAASWGTLGLAGALYGLLRPVAPTVALLALLWRTAEATLGGAASVLSFMALENFRTLAQAPAGSIASALAPLLGAGYSAAFHVALVFFSAGSALFFGLLMRTRHVPRALATFGLAASLLVALLSGVQLVRPSLSPALVAAWAPIFAAEIATGLWLLVRGAAAPDAAPPG